MLRNWEKHTIRNEMKEASDKGEYKLQEKNKESKNTLPGHPTQSNTSTPVCCATLAPLLRCCRKDPEAPCGCHCR